MQIIEVPVKSLKPYGKNPRKNDKAVEYVANSIRRFGFKQPIVIDSNYEIVCGHTRWKASKVLGLETVPCVMADDLTPEEIAVYRLADNKTAEVAEWDFDLLEDEFNMIDPEEFDLSDFGFFQDGETEEEETKEITTHGSLNDKYLIPPFSVLDARQGYWQNRKRLWNAEIQDDGSTRGTAQAFSLDGFQKYGIMPNMKKVSVLDPVLAECVIRWFTPCDHANIFDTFSGDTVFGYVAGKLGHKFTGIELREEQAIFNNERTANYDVTIFVTMDKM